MLSSIPARSRVVRKGFGVALPSPSEIQEFRTTDLGSLADLPVVRMDLLYLGKLLSPFGSERRQLDERSKIECAAVVGRCNWLGIGYESQIPQAPELRSDLMITLVSSCPTIMQIK
jgi:hypothetical protein